MSLSSLYALDPVLTPERRLWRAVLGQAYEDAESNSAESARELGKRECARHFLRADSPEEAEILAQVCEFAEIPMDRITTWARKRYPLAA
jgi:hypothetical protein